MISLSKWVVLGQTKLQYWPDFKPLVKGLVVMWDYSYCNLMTACGYTYACVPEVVHVRDLLHTQPTELTGTDCTIHSIAAAIIGLHDIGTTAGTGLDLFCIFNRESRRTLGISNRKLVRQYYLDQYLYHTSRFLIEYIERGNVIGTQCVAGTLTSSLVASLVWMPQLSAVVAKLCITTFPTAT